MDKLQKLNAKYIELVASWYSDPDAKLVAGTDSKTGYLFASDGHRAILLPDHPFDAAQAFVLNSLKVRIDSVRKE